MIIIRLMGGLGNQLQQYALYKKFISLGTDAKIDLSWFRTSNQEAMLAKRLIELDYIEGVKYEKASRKEVEALIGSDSLLGKVKRKLLKTETKKYIESVIYDSKLLELKDAYIEGYFACEYYYHDILRDLRKEFEFPVNKSSHSKEIEELVKDMKRSESVSIHIRRGDYMDEANKAMFGGICTSEYYGRSIRVCMERLENPKFYIFSDDVDYANDYASSFMSLNSGVEMRVVDINSGDDSFLDIYLMSQCRHTIAANSTFSFWGARLNDNDNPIKIRPTIHKNSQEFIKEDMLKWWPGWVFVSPSGDFYE